MNEELDRVTQTMDRLISNLPDAIDQLRAYGLTSLPRQLQNDLENLRYWRDNGGLIKKERSEMWRKQAGEYKAQHEKDTNQIALLTIALHKFKPDDCTCVDRPGDEYYCPHHGGEGCWIDLKVKTDMLVEKLGDWIVNQSNNIKRSAAVAFGAELKTLGQTIWKVADNENG
jgi:hypothetical protein